MIIELWSGGAEDSLHVAGYAGAALHEPSFDLTVEGAKAWAKVWVARDSSSDPPAGFLVAWHVADELHVLSVAVEPARRRAGIGRALLQIALDYARTSSIQLALLEVRSSNRPAIKLYRAFGFLAARTRPNYYADTGEDAVEMMLELSRTPT